MPNLGKIMRPPDDRHLGLGDDETVEGRIGALLHVNVPLLTLVLQRVAAAAATFASITTASTDKNFIKERKAG